MSEGGIRFGELESQEFERAWRDGSTIPQLSEFLKQLPDACSPRTAWSLVAIDLEYRWRKWGREPAALEAEGGIPLRPRLEDYARQFPQWLAIDTVWVDLVLEEFRARRQWAECPQAEEFCRRFGERFPEMESRLRQIACGTAETAQQREDDCTTADAGNPTITLPQAAPSVTITQALHPVSTSHLGSMSSERALPSAPASIRKIGDYEILSEIARGGMGVVFKARQLGLNRTVALKMILAGNLAGEEEVRRFYSEAEAAAQLDHPNIVPIYDVGEHEGRHYFSMGLVNGPSLKERIAEGPLPALEAAHLLRSVAGAVEYAHQQGIIHRDLKPANILIEESGQPRITDFGLAKRIEADLQMTATGQIMGTPSFMPPEQALGQSDQVGPSSDVYALGAVLYAVLTGRPPFQAANLTATLDQVIRQPPAAPRQLNPAIPRDLETICLKCLEKQPQRRYAAAAELEADLIRFLQHEPIKARPTGLLERGWRWCRRNPLVAALFSVASLCLIVLITGLWYRQQLAVVSELARRNQEIARQQRLLASTQRYHALVNQARQETQSAHHGWTWTALQALREAAKLPTDSQDPVELRTLAAEAASSVDLRQRYVLKDFRPSRLAFTSDNQQLAVAQFKGTPAASVFLYHLSTGKHDDTYTFSTLTGNLGRLFSGEVNRFQDSVSAIAVSDDHRWLAVGTRHGNIVCWARGSSSKEGLSWTAHQDSIRGLVFTPQDRLYSVAKSEDGVKVWDGTQNWKQLEQASPMLKVNQMVASADHATVALSGERLLLFDATTFALAANWPEIPGAWPLALSANGRFLARQREGAIELLDTSTGSTCRRFRNWEVRGTATGESFTFSHDSALLVSSGYGTLDLVALWDTTSGSLLATTTSAGDVLDATLSPDRRWLAVGEEHGTTVYEVRHPQVQTVTALSVQPIRGMNFSADGNGLHTVAGPASNPGDAKIPLTFTQWDWQAGLPQQEQHVEITGEGVNRFATLPLPLLWHPDGPVAMSPDGKRLWGVVDDHLVVCWDLPDRSVRSQWSNSLAKALTGMSQVNSLASGSHWVVAGCRNSNVLLLAAEDGQAKATWPGPGGTVHAVAIHPREQMAVVGTEQGMVRGFRIPQGTIAFDLPAHQQRVTSLAFRPDGRMLATASRDQSLRLWIPEGEAWTPYASLRSSTGPIAAIRFTPDGKNLAMLVEGEAGVRVWNFDALEQLWRSLELPNSLEKPLP